MSSSGEDQLFEFTVRMHGHAVGSIVTVAAEDRDGIEPLVQAGYLLPLVPEARPVPVPHRRARA